MEVIAMVTEVAIIGMTNDISLLYTCMQITSGISKGGVIVDEKVLICRRWVFENKVL